MAGDESRKSWISGRQIFNCSIENQPFALFVLLNHVSRYKLGVVLLCPDVCVASDGDAEAVVGSSDTFVLILESKAFHSKENRCQGRSMICPLSGY